MALQYRAERRQPTHSTISRRHLQASVEEAYELSDQSADQDGDAWSSDSGLDAPRPHLTAARHRSSSKISRRAEPERKSLSMQQRPEQRNPSHLNKPKQTIHSQRATPNPGGQVYFSPYSRNTQPAQSYNPPYAPPYGYPETPAYPYTPYVDNSYPNSYSYPYAQTQPYSPMPNSQQPGSYNAAPNLGQPSPYTQSSNPHYSTRDTSSYLNREVNELKTIIEDFKRDEHRQREEKIVRDNKAKAKREREKREKRKAREQAFLLKREAEEREMATQQELSDLRREIKQSLGLMHHKMMEVQDNRWDSGRTRPSLVDYTPRDWRLSDVPGGMSSLQDEFYEYLRNKRRQEERRSVGGGEVDDSFIGSLQRGLQVTSRPAMEVMDPDSLRKMIGSVLMELLPTLNKIAPSERNKDNTDGYVTKRIMKKPTNYKMEASKLREKYDWGKVADEQSDEDDGYLSLEHSDFEYRTPDMKRPPIATRVPPRRQTPKARVKAPFREPPELIVPKTAQIPSFDSGYGSLVGRSSTRSTRSAYSQPLSRKVSRPKGAVIEEPPKPSPRVASIMRPSKYRKPSVRDVGENSSSEESDNVPMIPERERKPYGIFKKRTSVEAPTPPSHSSDSDE